MSKGNDKVKIQKLKDLLENKYGYSVEHVEHDGWCEVHEDKPCNCDPDVIFLVRTR